LTRGPLPVALEIERRKPLIKARARHFWRGFLATRCTLEDLEAEATRAVWEAIKHWRDDGGAAFGTYVQTVVENELCKLVKFWNAGRRQVSLVSLSPGPEGELPVEIESPYATGSEHAEAESLRSQVRAAVDQLRPRQREVITLRYWQDQLQAEVGEQLGVTRQRVQQIEASAFDAMRPKLRHLWFGSEAA